MNVRFAGKKILILGSTNLEIEIINAAKEMGLYTIVTDHHTNWKDAPAKYVADEAWDISWSDIDALSDMCEQHSIEGCIAGFSEKKVLCASELSRKMGYHFYTDGADLSTITDKSKFKEACINSDIIVPKSYDYHEKMKYPVIVKPVDNAGGRGITICYSREELEKAYARAKSYSDSQQVLIEEYLEGEDAVETMFFYTVHNGKATLSLMLDGVIKESENGMPQLTLGGYSPSKYLDIFRQKDDENYKELIRNLGIQNGTIGFQAFVIGDDFLPYDPTYRVEGTVTYQITEHFNNTNVLKRMIQYSLTGTMGSDAEIEERENPELDKISYNLVIVLREGVITDVVGMQEVQLMKDVYYVSQIRNIGDVIRETGNFSQAFGGIYMMIDEKSDIEKNIKKILNTLDVLDENGESMIINKANFYINK